MPSASLPIIARVSVILFAALATVSIAACGENASSQAVIKVRGHVITKTEFAHWMAVTAARDYNLSPDRPVPSWVLPDPPRYARCIAHLQTVPPTSGTESASPARNQCQRRYDELRTQVLTSLTTAEWLISEGEERGLSATAKEIQARFAAVKRNLFGSEAAFEAYLKYTGETVADQLFRAKIKVYSVKLEAKARNELLSGKIGRQAFARRAAEFPKKWSARTTCLSGYVMPNCKQYKGQRQPKIELL
jgi:hypothetical protein